jgi:hypothetical protein
VGQHVVAGVVDVGGMMSVGGWVSERGRQRPRCEMRLRIERSGGGRMRVRDGQARGKGK